MVFPYVPNYGGTWQTGAPGATPITEAALDNLETQFASLIALLTIRGDMIYRGAATWERLAKGTEGRYLRQGANDPGWSDLVIVAETEAFASAAAPVDNFTDLDLSAIVGTGEALVLIKVTNGVANIRAVMFRVNGDAEPTTGQGSGCAAITNAANDIGYIIIATDAGGIVEWTGTNAGQTTTLDVVAYIPTA